MAATEPLCRSCREIHRHQTWSCTLPPLCSPTSLVSSVDAPTALPHPEHGCPIASQWFWVIWLKTANWTDQSIPLKKGEPRNMKGIWQFEMGAQIGRVRLMSAVQVERMRKKEWCVNRGSWSVGREEDGQCRQQKEAESQVEGETMRPTGKQEEQLAHIPCSKFTSSLSDWINTLQPKKSHLTNFRARRL